MKKNALLCLLLMVAYCGVSQAQEPATVEFPITMHRSYGPFSPGFIGLYPYAGNEPDNQWKGTYVYAKGVPDDWTEVKQGGIETDYNQLAYQSYLSGKITPEWYEHLQKAWDWKPVPEMYSDEPIRTKVVFAIGKNALGQQQVIIDANGNLDFSDDTPFTPLEMSNVFEDKEAWKKSIDVLYERYVNGKVKTETVPLMVVQNGSGGGIMYNFPTYATTQVDGRQVLLFSSGFVRLSWQETSLLLLEEGVTMDPVKVFGLTLSDGDYLDVNGVLYKNKGVNPYKNVLVLEKVTTPKKQIYSAQVGFQAPLFDGENAVTKEDISLKDYKGKYLLIDVWAVWCGPCIQEMPNLKALYERTDRSQFEILGVVGGSSHSKLMAAMEKHAITWPQILSDQTNNITELYGVKGYPTTLLVDPNGVIVGKNLRGKDLDNKIEELLKP